jgi:hypothetical protein
MCETNECHIERQPTNVVGMFELTILGSGIIITPFVVPFEPGRVYDTIIGIDA